MHPIEIAIICVVAISTVGITYYKPTDYRVKLGCVGVTLSLLAQLYIDYPTQSKDVTISNAQYGSITVADTEVGRINLGSDIRFENGDVVTVKQDRLGRWGIK